MSASTAAATTMPAATPMRPMPMRIPQRASTF